MEDIKNKWDYYDYLRCVPAIIFGCIIFYVSSLSNPFPAGPPRPPDIFELKVNPNDIMHICEFALFGFLIAFGFLKKVKSRYVISFAVVYAFLDEVHQYFVPSRYFDLYDFLLDSIGVIMGFLIYFSLIYIISRVKKNDGELYFNNNEQ